jgi:phospholipid/cholesterol/gamma-HCH transport system substrate-binding protein
VPSRKEIKWSQLRVGLLVLAATAILIGLIFLMSNSSGGLFTPKIVLRAYFENANGLRDGAPVTLEGVTIGNVLRVRVVPDRNPAPVEVTMRVGSNYLHTLHTDSVATITQAGVLGDSFVDIDSTRATGPPPTNNSEIQRAEAPSIQDVIRTSQVSIQDINVLTHKVDTLVDSLNNKKGTIGMLINDPTIGRKLTQMATDMQTVTSSITQGKGSLGKLLTDDTLYTRASSAVDKLNQITTDLQAGKGSAGKFLKDETLYDNLNAAVANTNQLVGQINQGKGALGKFSTDPAFAQKLDDTVTTLDAILRDIHEGKGTLGQMAQNRSLFDHADQTADQAQQLLKAIREDPKKYFVIHMKLF